MLFSIFSSLFHPFLFFLFTYKLFFEKMDRLHSRLYLGGFVILFLSLFYYQVIRGDYYYNRATNNYLRTIPLSPIRGTIFDRNSLPIAYDRASFNIAVIPFEVKNKKDALFKKISNFLNYDLDVIRNNYRRKIKNFFSPVDIIVDIDKETALLLKEHFGKDILINSLPQRYYPFPYEFAHIIGYVKEVMSFYQYLKKYGYSPTHRVGFSGIEQYYDTYLRGEEGGDILEINAQGEVVGFLGERQALKGKDIYLTIDYKMQMAGYQSLKGRRGTIILMDSRKGEILSLVSSPSFNPNYFTKGKGVKKFLRSIYSPLANRAIQGKYPLGSTFKPVVATAALEERKVSASTIFNCKGKISIKRTEFKCWTSHGPQNIYQALAHSCNVYFYNLGLRLKASSIAKWAKRFGLDSLSEIDLPYENKGFIPTPSWKSRKLNLRWFDGDTLNLSIGQGFIEATPLEAALAINVFANGGYLLRPYLVNKIGKVKSVIAARSYIGISKETLETVKKGLIATVEDEEGTAHILKDLNLKIAGKTGTAETTGKSHGWFIGFFPYDNPKYTICVFLEHGGSSFQALKVTYSFLKTLKEEGYFSYSRQKRTPLSPDFALAKFSRREED
jgi:penicillin-binding protein 2